MVDDFLFRNLASGDGIICPLAKGWLRLINLLIFDEKYLLKCPNFFIEGCNKKHNQLGLGWRDNEADRGIMKVKS